MSFNSIFVSEKDNDFDDLQQESEPWNILVVDDDESVHEVTKLALDGFSFMQRGLNLIHCYSAAEARDILDKNDNIALALIDVVMEEQTAGLKLVKWIRNKLENRSIRLVLRTGQPGLVIENDVIKTYDINDYKEKSELTVERLLVVFYNCLRSYKEIKALEIYGASLENIINATSDLFSKKAINVLSEGLLKQISACFGFLDEGIACFYQTEEEEIIIVGATQLYTKYIGCKIDVIEDQKICSNVAKTFKTKSNIFDPKKSFLYLPSGARCEGVVYLKSRRLLTNQETNLLTLFMNSIALGFDNANLFEQLQTTAYVDPVTELYTRAGLFMSVENHKESGSNVMILALNINNFQSINKFYGFTFGDEILRTFAELLIDLFPNAIGISRFSGDHFVLVYRENNVEDEIYQSLNKIVLKCDSREHEITVNGGLSCTDISSPNNLNLDIQRAIFARKLAKQQGIKQIIRYNPMIEEERYLQLELVEKLKIAIRDVEFQVYYQPKVDVISNRAIGAEALVRWILPDGKVVSPGLFIPVALEADLLFQIDTLVMKLVADHQSNWIKDGLSIPVSINISPSYINEEKFLDTVFNVFVESDVSIENIEFEVLEESIIDDVDKTIAILSSLQKLGFKISLDDFGTGYSSLSSLHKLPIDTIKADRSFMDANNAEVAARMLAVISSVAASLSMNCIAEGVETETDLDLVKTVGIRNVQGYFFAKPMPLDAFLEWWEKSNESLGGSGNNNQDGGCK